MASSVAKPRSRLPADPNEPAINPFEIIVDNAEQLPYTFAGFRTDEPPSSKRPRRPLIVPLVVKSIDTGDYSIPGHELAVSIERKSLADAYGTFGRDRERFEKELYRLNCMECGNVVIEAEWSTIMSRVCPVCYGAGFSIPQTSPVLINLTPATIDSVGIRTVADVLREAAAAGKVPHRSTCQNCTGTGKLHPLENSHLSPRSVMGSIVAWRSQFPNVHFWTVPGRAAAERFTFRLLKRFWEERERERIADERAEKKEQAARLAGMSDGFGVKK